MERDLGSFRDVVGIRVYFVVYWVGWHMEKGERRDLLGHEESERWGTGEYVWDMEGKWEKRGDERVWVWVSMLIVEVL